MNPALSALFNLPPERASAYLRAKGLRLTGPYWELDGPGHSRVFTVANLAKLDVLADIKGAVQQALDAGKTERWFKAELVDTLRRKGWWGPAVTVDPDTGEARMVQQGSLRRLQTIYRTGLQSAYMAGRHRQAMEQAQRAPWAQYLAIRDSRTRPAHAALHGRVFRLDSPEWSAISPPNGYNCRCRARYLSDRELAARGLTPETDVAILERDPPGKRPLDPLTGETPGRWIQRGVSVPSRTGDGRDVLYADPGWDHLPGSIGAERKLVDRLMARAEELGDGIKQVILADLARRGADFARAAAAAGAAKQTAYVVMPTLESAAETVRKAGVLDPRDAEAIRRAAVVLDHDRVRHIVAQHGDAGREAARGQRAIVPGDFALLPEILRNVSAVRRGTPERSYSGAPLVEVQSRVGNELWTLVLELRRKQGTVSVYSAWVRPQGSGAAPPAG